MATMLEHNLSPDRLDQLVKRENLRLAWRMRFLDLFSNHLTPAQHAQLHAKYFQVFGSSGKGKSRRSSHGT